MDTHQTAARALVATMLEATGLEPTQLARKAGLSPTTLTRFLNYEVKHTLSARTLAKLSAASGVPVPMAIAGGAKPVGQFVEDPEEIAWLDLWRRMSKEMRGVTLAALRSTIPPRDKDGMVNDDSIHNDPRKNSV